MPASFSRAAAKRSRVPSPASSCLYCHHPRGLSSMSIRRVPHSSMRYRHIGGSNNFLCPSRSHLNNSISSNTWRQPSPGEYLAHRPWPRPRAQRRVWPTRMSRRGRPRQETRPTDPLQHLLTVSRNTRLTRTLLPTTRHQARSCRLSRCQA